MTTELTKAAQQALEAFDAFADADDFPTCFELTKKMNALRRALTASQPAPTAQELERAAEMCDGFAAPDMAAALRSQPAQAGEVDERVAFEAWLGREAFTKRSDSGKYESVHVDAMWSAWQARASMPTQPAAQATPVQDVGASADYWGDLAQQKADADARRGVSMPVSYYTSSIVGALLATQQATPVQYAEALHLFEFWWAAHMPQATQAQAWKAWTAAQYSKGAAIEAPQQATPEPVGEVYGWAVTGLSFIWRGEHAQACAEQEAKTCGGTSIAFPLFTRPAPGVPDGEVVKPKVEIDLGEGDPRTARIVWSDWDSKANKLVLCLSVRDPEGFALVPIKSDDAILRPFYNCPPEELGLAWDAAMRVAQVRLAAAQTKGGEHA